MPKACALVLFAKYLLPAILFSPLVNLRELDPISKQIEKLDLDKNVKSSILSVIDLKHENDMTHFEPFIKSEFEKTNSKIDNLNTSLSAEISKNSHKINLLYWFIGAFGVFVSVLKFIG